MTSTSAFRARSVPAVSGGFCNRMKILVIGWHGMRNTGDDAMALVFHQQLTRLGHSVRFLAESSRLPRPDAKTRLKGFPALMMRSERVKMFFLRRLMTDYDVLLFGGGSLFHSENSILWKTELVRHFKARSTGRGLCGALGVSLGPFNTPRAEKMCAALLKEFDFLALRESASFRIASAMKLPYRPEKSFDLSLLLLNERAAVWKGFRQEETNKKATVGFALAYPGGKEKGEAVVIRIARAIDSLLEKRPDAGIMLFCLGGHKTLHNDRGFNESVRGRCRNKSRVSIIPYSKDPLFFLRKISLCTLFVSMKLHGALFAFMAGVNFIILDYHVKCRSFAEDIGFNRKFILDYGIFSVKELVIKINACLLNRALNWRLPFQNARRASAKNIACFQKGISRI